MIFESDIQDLIQSWIERSQSSIYPDEYQKATAECAFELQCTLDKLFNEEVEAREYFNSLEADNYLASIEAHELAA